MKVYGIDSGLEEYLFYKGEALLRPFYPFFVPDLEEQWVAVPSLAVRIGRTGKYVEAPFVYRYIESYAAAWDVTCLSRLDRLKRQGAPWETAKVCDGSAVATGWVVTEEVRGEAPRLTYLDHSWICPMEKIERGVVHLSKGLTIHKGDVLLINLLSPELAPEIHPEESYLLTLHSSSGEAFDTLLRVK